MQTAKTFAFPIVMLLLSAVAAWLAVEATSGFELWAGVVSVMTLAAALASAIDAYVDSD